VVDMVVDTVVDMVVDTVVEMVVVATGCRRPVLAT